MESNISTTWTISVRPGPKKKPPNHPRLLQSGPLLEHTAGLFMVRPFLRWCQPGSAVLEPQQPGRGREQRLGVRESGVILRSLPSCLSSRGQSCPTLHASCLRSGSNQRPGSMCADQHREEAGRRVKMAACGWAGWDLHSSLFRHQTIPMSPQTRSDRRVIIFASFTRLCAVPDRANDIDPLRGPPVARDRGPAQWQVFSRGPRGNAWF